MWLLKAYDSDLKFVYANTDRWDSKINFDGEDAVRVGNIANGLHSFLTSGSFHLKQRDVTIQLELARYAPDGSVNDIEWIAKGNSPYILRMVVCVKDEECAKQLLKKFSKNILYEYSDEDMELLKKEGR